MNATDNELPRMVQSHDVSLDQDYALWIAELKSRYRNAQARAAVKVNAEQLLFNWQLGHDLCVKKAEERWGAGVVEQLSLDLKAEFPGVKGFSTTNLWSMKKWYSFYSDIENAQILQQAVVEFRKRYEETPIKYQQVADIEVVTKLHQPGGEIDKEKLHQSGEEFPLLFALVPWRHHVEIINKCKTCAEALYYIKQTIDAGWSREALKNAIKADIYHKQGTALNNYSATLPTVQSAMMQEIVKSNYDFSFATVKHATYDETELEDALYANITDMLLELGNGFAFIGRQKEILAVGKDRKVDLLFYHIRQRCYVVVELKAKSFEPEFASKLNFYVNACNELVKQPEDNPTVGLLICTDYNETEVRWSFEGIQTPLGVATYDNVRILELLPTKEQIKERVKRLETELREAKRLENKLK